jgi:CHAD domain-containing protein
MNCLDKYRSKLVREINKDLRIILVQPEEESVHDFRVGIKRLTALYYFLSRIDTELKAKRILKPYRSLFKSIGNIRDAHIAMHLIQGLDDISTEDTEILVKALRSNIRKDYRGFQATVRAHSPISIRTPTVSSTGISARAILRLKPVVLNELLLQILGTEGRMNARQWHKKRILLKRYHHKMDAFCYCPGHKSDENEIKHKNTGAAAGRLARPRYNHRNFTVLCRTRGSGWTRHRDHEKTGSITAGFSEDLSGQVQPVASRPLIQASLS